jgi:hypothetical protein
MKDSTRFTQLKRQARESAVSRGHMMDRFQQQDNRGYADRFIGLSECLLCGMYVQVDTRPAANGISIGGPAVALGCGDKV